MGNVRRIESPGLSDLLKAAIATIAKEDVGCDQRRIFFQLPAALLHRERGNRHGVDTVGGAALDKLDGPERPDVEFEIGRFRAQLARALVGEGDPPRLEFRTDARERQ